MPVFCFAASQVPSLSWIDYLLVFVILHIFLYPASNGFNSFYDKDEDSIGGLEKPPPVEKALLHVSLVFDGIALLLGLYFGWAFVGMLLVYGLASKAYSHPWIRLKKRPIAGWLTVAFFQGFFTYVLCYYALSHCELSALIEVEVLLPGLLMSLLLGGSYPMTQVYQHEEDSKRGDNTLSIMLGIRGTFYFAVAFFLVATGGFFYYFSQFGELQYFWLFLLFLLPVLIYFNLWYLRVHKDEEAADFRSTMRLNMLSSVCMIVYFTVLLVL